MTSETAKNIGTILVVVGVICFVFSCGSCYSCVVTKRQPVSDGQGEYFITGDGRAVPRAVNYDTKGEHYGYYVLVPLVLGVIMSFAGTGIIHNSIEKEVEESSKALKKHFDGK